MIPKTIHYCWFGRKPLPEKALKCIDSWKKFFPDYEIKQWNEDNFDVYSIPYTAEAYMLGKYAFVSDYARVWVLYNYGGVYFDTDVEVIRPFDDIVAAGAFMGFEEATANVPVIVPGKICAPGLGMGCEVGLSVFKEVCHWYQSHHYALWNGKSGDAMPYIISEILRKKEVTILDDITVKCGEVLIYSPEVFCPKDYTTGELKITEHTRSIHHYAATWVSRDDSLYGKIKRRLSYFWARLRCSFRHYHTLSFIVN